MKMDIVSSIDSYTRFNPRVLNQLAKRIVLSKLDCISRGWLQIVDEDRMYQFGHPETSSLKATITVRDASFYRSLAFAGSVGVGEAYVQGDWDCDDLTSLVRIFLENRAVLDTIDNGTSTISAIFNKCIHWLNKNTRSGSRRNIAAHYDIGNDLFELMLDKTMSYSAAVYPDQQSSLEKASLNKMELLCQKLELTSADHILEIGTGWGGFAVYAAKNYACHVTTTTISRQQYEYASELIKRQGLEDKIELLLKDYRDLDGQYDKLVSIEMIEAVGLNNLNAYFKKCSNLLKPEGLMCLQSITIEDQRYEQSRREVDFIQKYIFPGGGLPSITAITNSLTQATDMRINTICDIGIHYARTLHDWRERFFNHEHKVRSLGYGESFIRLWEFYLCYCEGGFLENSISTVHAVLAKPGYRKQTC
ncbi:MAG: cyclopropane-fatty-acyl-phospholipid synthase family protein [Gammaproteobacteria bacterium]|nr:cyclopropane-fatty-acyl-phospholipid synthase family protein [Gammaproteobacteria bacterium]